MPEVSRDIEHQDYSSNSEYRAIDIPLDVEKPITTLCPGRPGQPNEICSSKGERYPCCRGRAERGATKTEGEIGSYDDKEVPAW